ncbi:MAG TPA: chorismate lyase [Dongiaceae bacterium]|nr:chorismate lyase [Dongiaceae bacterium]
MSQPFLPSILHEPALYRGGRGSLPPFRIPRAYRSWLLDPGSLTRRLIRESDGHFRVQVLRQGFLSAYPEERRQLGLELGEWPFVREVALRCHDTPWVFARTLIPAATLQGPAKALTHLGTKPLGAVLFNDPRVRRGPIAVCRLRGSQLGEAWREEGEIWGRRSCFYLAGLPLLVSEYFLHACPMYANSGNGDNPSAHR